MLAAVSVLAVLAAVAATPWHRYREEQWARRQLEQVDGAWYSTGSSSAPWWDHLLPRGLRLPFERVTVVDLADAAVRPEQLQAIALLRHLERLNLAGKPIGDAQLSYWARMPRLAELDLSHTRVTSQGLAELATLPSLKWLNLRGTQIDDTGLDYLRRAPALVYLDLAGTNVTGAGLRQLADLEHLQVLHLENTAIDDSALVQLPPWPRLEFLFSEGSEVTSQGLDQLRRSRPGLKAT